jgi:nucleoside-diphosphate-sugar epimerase
MLAGVVGREVSEQAAALTMTTNVAGLENVLQLCLRAGSRLVFFSSSEVYGSQDGVMDEATCVPRPNNRYALSKWLGEQLIEYEARHHGLQAVVLRPFTIYDENEEAGDHRSAMIRFAWHLARGQQIEVHRGSARGWLHISDAVRAIESAGRLREFAVINIGHPEVVQTAEVAEMIRRELSASPALIQLRELPARMTLIKRPRLQRQLDLLDFRPLIPLERGIGWVCAHQTALLASQPSGPKIND